MADQIVRQDDGLYLWLSDGKAVAVIEPLDPEFEAQLLDGMAPMEGEPLAN